jgi:AcrR family transcriptional regulator
MSSLLTLLTGFAEYATPTDRERIVAAAQVLYWQHGIAAVAMTDLTRHLGLPESQVAHLFPSKEPLVWAVVNELSYTLHEQLSQCREHSSNAVKEMLTLRAFFAKQADLTDSPFSQELAADYPACQERWLMHMSGFPADHLRNNMRWGMLQELYHANLEVETLVQQVMQEQSQHPSVFIMHLLAGMVTPAGVLLVQQMTGSPAAA